MAFVPLHTLLKCATDLHARFAQKINPPDVTQFLDAEGNPPTLSVGVAICHHLEPLSDALKLVRDAEQTAKGLKRKDALAIILSKRSGADISIRGHWGELDLRLQRFVDLHRLDAVPDGAAFELQDLSERLRSRGIDSKQAKLADQEMGALARAEAERILRRKQPQRGKKQILAEKTLSTILSAMQPSLASISALANGLIVARIVAQAEEAAGYPEPDARDEEKEL